MSLFPEKTAPVVELESCLCISKVAKSRRVDIPTRRQTVCKDPKLWQAWRVWENDKS